MRNVFHTPKKIVRHRKKKYYIFSLSLRSRIAAVGIRNIQYYKRTTNGRPYDIPFFVCGMDKVCDVLKKNKVAFLLEATDAGADGTEKIIRHAGNLKIL